MAILHPPCTPHIATLRPESHIATAFNDICSRLQVLVKPIGACQDWVWYIVTLRRLGDISESARPGSILTDTYLHALACRPYRRPRHLQDEIGPPFGKIQLVDLHRA